MSPSAALPWEVIERVIDHSKDTRTLYSFTLTCRDLRPRSTILLLGRVEFKNRNQLFDLCAVLQTKPHLQPCVQSVSMNAHEFSPHPLLRMLPNLSEIEFTDIRDAECPLTFHASVLTHCRQFGQHIRTLSLVNLQFLSLSAFSHILLSLPRIESLSCTDLDVNNNIALPELITRRLSERLHLRTLIIHGDIDDKILTLLKEAVKHSIATLVYQGSSATQHREQTESFLLASPSDWVQLTSFIWTLTTLRSSTGSRESLCEHATNILRNFRPPKLREVAVVFPVSSFRDIAMLPLPAPELCSELEKTLMEFPQPTLSLCYCRPINSRQHHSWMRMLQRLFPMSGERGVLTINGEYSGFAGHDGKIQTPIITSADNRRAATGSEDGTIIIWDLESGQIREEWFAEETGVGSIAFSPDGRYIISTGITSAAGGEWGTIWDLRERGSRVKSLKGEAGCSLRCYDCSWSPDGSWVMIAARAQLRLGFVGLVRTWETTSFQPLHSWERQELLTVSADGRWVLTGNLNGFDLDPTHHRIWSVESGKWHRLLGDETHDIRVAVFNPESTRIATASGDCTLRIWDVRTGEEFLVLKERIGSPPQEERAEGRAWDRVNVNVNCVACSRDGRMILSHLSSRSTSSHGDGVISRNGYDAVQVWDASNGALLASESLEEPGTRADIKDVHVPSRYTACFSPCGSYVASVSISGGKGALLWRTSDWSCIAEVSGGGAPVTHVAISPDGRVLCWGTDAGTVFFRRMHDLISASQD